MHNLAKVRSFDLVAKKEFVEIADIAHLPVKDKSVDICVFCLSLMGTNYINFLQ
jgi:ribosomal RNA-processing protein 8